MHVSPFQLTNDVIESENRLSQMELMINEKESQLRYVFVSKHTPTGHNMYPDIFYILLC